MHLFENKARSILAQHGIQFPRWVVATNELEVKEFAQEIGKKVELVPLILTDQRDFVSVDNSDEAEALAKKTFDQVLLGRKVSRVLVQEKVESSLKFFAYVCVDRYEEKPMAFLSKSAILNIYSSKHLESSGVPFKHFKILDGLCQFETRELAKSVGFSGAQIPAFGSFLWNLHRAWIKNDLEVIATEPTVVTNEGRPLVTKLNVRIDEDAYFRHPELKLDEEINALKTVREKAVEATGTPFVDLQGDVGMIVAGSGMGMAANDVVALHGQKPNNMSDIGGGPTPERVATLVETVISNPAVKKVLVYYFGGISRCDDFARGLLIALEKYEKPLPMIIKLAGTKMKEGHEIINKALEEKPRLREFIKSVHGTDISIDELAQKIAKL